MTIIPLEPFNRDDRGYNCEYYHDRIGQHIIVFSKAGSVRGRHYHKGNSLNKNPEIIILLSGTCTFNWREPNSKNPKSETVSAPARIEIPPYTWHELIYQTDSAMIEMNSLSEHAADTFYDS